MAKIVIGEGVAGTMSTAERNIRKANLDVDMAREFSVGHCSDALFAKWTVLKSRNPEGAWACIVDAEEEELDAASCVVAYGEYRD